MSRHGSLDLAPIRLRVVVDGIVQGVGFRPFVSAIAGIYGLTGFVGNDPHGVFVEIEGDSDSVERFLRSLSVDAPPLARVDHISTTVMTVLGGTTFTIVPSSEAATHDAIVAADAATCADCLREITDPTDRRYHYPFTNCTNCGPRYTIVRDLPYDRERTTMAGFEMCPECQAEYDDPRDRRYHAQPVCCPACGPRLELRTNAGELVAGEAISETADLLSAGAVVAIKGVGGYHLAVDATNADAVRRLRSGKHREERPFALMVTDLAATATICTVSDDAARLLNSPQHPIVLLPRRTALGATVVVAAGVAPNTQELGVMLPYSPLHHLLLAAVGRPLVMTSGNRSDEPIAFDDLDATARLGSIATAFLSHDRPIETRVDDSVARVTAAGPMLLRRSRGYAPEPVSVPWEFSRPVLACGPEQKNTFCLGRGHHAFLSHHVGDLESFETFSSYNAGIEHLQRLLAISPAIVAYDLHPEYLSTKYALDRQGVDLVGVQHHHAHIASCLADNQVAGPVIGVAFDGTGYGTDGTVWGGEFLIADLTTATRAAHLSPVPLPGGAAAIREPWRMAASYLDATFSELPAMILGLAQRHPERWDQVRAAATAGINSPLTSSAGRLFDAVAALLDVRDTVGYEGQAAVELEQLVDSTARGTYAVAITDEDVPQLMATDLIRAVLADRAANVASGVIAARFHQAVADMIGRTAQLLRERHGLGVVALSGGVFQNVRLLDATTAGLVAAGFEVLTHHRVPTNDGGISLGQAVVAAARDRSGQLDDAARMSDVSSHNTS